MIELLIALGVTALVMALAATHVSDVTRAWRRAGEVEADLTQVARVEAMLDRFAELADAQLPNALEISESGDEISLGETARLYIDETNRLVLEAGEAISADLPVSGDGEDWRFALIDWPGARRIDVFEGARLRFTSRIHVDQPLPCRYDAIGRRCLAAATP